MGTSNPRSLWRNESRLLFTLSAVERDTSFWDVACAARLSGSAAQSTLAVIPHRLTAFRPERRRIAPVNTVCTYFLIRENSIIRPSIVRFSVELLSLKTCFSCLVIMRN